jgi:hypothetical protein
MQALSFGRCIGAHFLTVTNCKSAAWEHNGWTRHVFRKIKKRTTKNKMTKIKVKTGASRPTWCTTSLRNCASLPQAQSKGYHLRVAVILPCVASRKIALIDDLFWGSEFISITAGASRKSIVGTPASVHGSKVYRRGLFRIDELGASDRCRTVRVIWLATLFHSVIRGEIIMDTISAT